MHQLAAILTAMRLQHFSLFLYHRIFQKLSPLLYFQQPTVKLYGSLFARLGEKDLSTSSEISSSLQSLRSYGKLYKVNEHQRHFFVRKKRDVLRSLQNLVRI